MSFIDKFLDLTTNLPREIVRILKLYKFVEERSRNINTNLKSLRLKYLKEIKERESTTKEMLIPIDKYYKELLTLSDYKQELIKELKYILEEDFLNKIPPIIEEGQKECQEQILSSNMNLPYSPDAFANTNFTKPITEEKSVSDINEKQKNKEKVVGIKTYRNNKYRIRKKNLVNSEYSEEVAPNDEDSEILCFCNRHNFGTMILCEKCKRWLHYECVGLKEGDDPTDEKWFCPDCVENKEKKKKKKH